MLGIYYTGAEDYLTAQINKEESIGGFISSSTIPNGVQNAFFSSISIKIFEVSNYREFICVAVKNLSGGAINNLKCWLELSSDSDSDLFKYSLNIVSPTISNNKKSFEKTPTKFSTPTVGTFYDTMLDENSALIVSSLANNDYLGIWVKRELKDVNILSDEFIIDNFKKVLPKQEIFNLKFKY